MTKPPWDSVPWYFENVRDKWDVLDWERLPDDPCDLNYRPAPIPGAMLSTVVPLLIVSAVSLVVAWIFRWYVGWLLWSQLALALTILTGVICGLAALMLRTSDLPPHRKPSITSVAAVTVGPVILWAIASTLPFTAYQFGALLLLILFVVPAVIILSDALATHAVHWFSAHPGNDRATMLGWRADWKSRWTSIPERAPRRKDLTQQELNVHRQVMQARETYLNGALWLIALSVVLPLTIFFTLTRKGAAYEVGACTTFGLLAGLALVGWTRCAQWPGAFRMYIATVASWLTYQREQEMPPWVFESPGGSADRRRWTLFLVLFLAVAAIVPLTDWGNWLILSDAQRPYIPGPIVDAVENHRTPWHPSVLQPYAVLCLILQWLVCLLLPIAYLLLAGFVIAGPVIAAHHAALEAPGAYEPHSDWTRLDGYEERLRNSSNPFERAAIVFGMHTLYDFPILLDTALLFEHVHCLGGTGTGKTALGLTTQKIQLIRRGDGPVLIIDCKGDRALFHTARLEAERSGRRFKWFTNKPRKATYVFNPLDFRAWRHFTLAEVVGYLSAALNLIHGHDYGRAWFTIAARILMRRSFGATIPNHESHGHHRYDADVGPINSFRDLNRMVLRVALQEDIQAAQHVAYLIECLADFEQLNLAPHHHPKHPAVANAIHMPEVLQEKQVVYFFLQGATDLVSVAEIGRLAMFSLLSACIAHADETGRTPRAYCICDEAHALVANNIATVLAQARSHGLAITLAHQSMSQLAPPGGMDLRELVIDCTCLKQIFSARDPWLQEYISKMSGTAKYATVAESWNSQAGVWEPTYSYTVGPRLTAQDIFDVNRDDNACIATIERGKGLSRTIGYYPMHVDWPMTEREYQTRTEETPWPAASPETVTIHAPWPNSNDETIETRTHPPRTPEDSPANAEARLRELREQLDD